MPGSRSLKQLRHNTSARMLETGWFCLLMKEGASLFGGGGWLAIGECSLVMPKCLSNLNRSWTLVDSSCYYYWNACPSSLKFYEYIKYRQRTATNSFLTKCLQSRSRIRNASLPNVTILVLVAD